MLMFYTCIYNKSQICEFYQSLQAFYLDNEIDNLFSVRMPREGALDSATILMISNYARMKVDNLKTDFLKFEPIEYSEKLVSDMDFEVNLSVYSMYYYVINASHVL